MLFDFKFSIRLWGSHQIDFSTLSAIKRLLVDSIRIRSRAKEKKRHVCAAILLGHTGKTGMNRENWDCHLRKHVVHCQTHVRGKTRIFQYKLSSFDNEIVSRRNRRRTNFYATFIATQRCICYLPHCSESKRDKPRTNPKKTKNKSIRVVGK